MNKTEKNAKYTLADMQELAASKKGKCLSDEYLGMHTKLQWECEKKHRWFASPDSIKHSSSWCPYCSGRKCLPHESFGALHEILVNELHPIKNACLNVFEISPGSNKKVWWLCSNDQSHEWETTIGYRVRGYTCPFCNGTRPSNRNNLAIHFPSIAKEWNYKKNGGLKPEDFLPHARKKVWWICPKNIDHDYEAWIDNRTSKTRSGCPYCKGLKVNHTNSLEALYPEIAKQWHPTKNGSLTAADVSPGSDKKVWWGCERSTEHDWKTSIGERTRGSGCPSCSPQTSMNEIRIFTELETLFPQLEQRIKLNGFEADIYLRQINLAIEYDGSYWHKGSKKFVNDRKKNQHFSKQNITLLRVREHPLEKISEHDIIVKDRPLKKEDLNNIIKTIEKICSLDHRIFTDYENAQHFTGDQRYNQIVGCLPGPPPEKSLAALFPEIAATFHPTKNAPLTPSHYYPGGGQQVWWLCPKDNQHEWQTTPNSRTFGNYGCPMCSGMMASPTNNLAVLHPNLMKEWHHDKNTKYDPFKIKPGSNYKVWWKCSSNSKHEWQAVIAHRVNGKQKCPKCFPHFISDENNFEKKFPQLAREWHPTKNGELKPHEVTPVAHKKVWWLCTKNSDHDWIASVGSRAGLGTGCAICNGPLCERNESLLAKYPKLAAEWHPIKNNDLQVDRVKPTSSRNVWWICKSNNKHEWKEVVSRRVKGSNCPKCFK